MLRLNLPEIEIAMSADVLTGDGEAIRLTPHPLRAAVPGEVHARPFTPISVPSRIVHFAFDTSGTRAQVDRASLIIATRSALPSCDGSNIRSLPHTAGEDR